MEADPLLPSISDRYRLLLTLTGIGAVERYLGRAREGLGAEAPAAEGDGRRTPFDEAVAMAQEASGLRGTP